MIFDPRYLLFALPALLVMLYAQHRVRSTYARYSDEANLAGLSGAEAGDLLLRQAGLYDVAIEPVRGELTDHYDPGAKVLRLSQGVYGVPSVAALGIVAHEVGHAVQDATGYLPMRLRAGLVPLVNVGSLLGWVFFTAGLALAATKLVWLGVALFSAGTLFALVTLPVEFDASRRGLKMLKGLGLVNWTDERAVREVLSAAALTYVAGLLMALSDLLYWVTLASGLQTHEES